MLVALLLCPPSQAQSAERPDLPFRSIAGEDGAHVLYANPALMNFDRDGMYAAWYQTTISGDGLESIAAATTGAGLGGGIGYRQFGTDSAGWWTFSSGASVRVSEALAVGSALHWQLPEGGDNNFVSWDLGAGWRPVPWLGFGGAAQNVGSPAPDLGVDTGYKAGFAVRPWGDVATIGVDWIADAPPDSSLAQKAGLNLRLHPVRGLWVRAWGESPFDDPGAVDVGGALEIHLGDLAVGVDGRGDVAGGAAGAGGYLASIPRQDQLFLPGKDVAVFELDHEYPYHPRGGLFAAAPEGYLTLLRRLHTAARDPQVRGILIEVGESGFSLAQIEEVRGLLQEARDNRKPVVAYINGEASNGAYLLASGCDRVFLHPAGQLDLVGLGAEIQFYKGALELIGVEAQYAKRAEYKSAPEQWTHSQSSGPAREEMNVLLDDLNGTLVQAIALGRGKTSEEITGLIDRGPFTAQEALDNGLIDGLMYPDELDHQLGGSFPKGYNLVSGYAQQPDMSGWEPQRAVAVVTVDGAIVSGPSTGGGLFGGGATGSETVTRELDQARRSGAVKAVVLRVDSPGGSSFASDEIWRAVERVKQEGKPVIVSMGGYAASGGYYVSAGANAIYALPSTVTGSIGVYGGKINADGLFDRLHITTERFDRGRNASMYSVSAPFDDVQLAALDRLVGETYKQFKERVETGRNLSGDQVEAIARGRVWSGKAAADRGLVDSFGGFYDAVDRARAEAGMSERSPYALTTYDVSGGGGGTLPTQVIRAWLSPRIDLPAELQPMLSLLALRKERSFAMLPYHLEIE